MGSGSPAYCHVVQRQGQSHAAVVSRSAGFASIQHRHPEWDLYDVAAFGTTWGLEAEEVDMTVGLQVSNPLFDLVEGSIGNEEFVDQLELLPPDVCACSHLLRLIELAPTQEARAALIGFYDTRVAYSSLFDNGFIQEASEAAAAFRGQHPIDDHPALSTDSDFVQLLDSIDPCLCNRAADVMALIQSAPDKVSQAYFIGVLEARTILAHYAGGSFIDE
jgi:hypothetical protein